MRRLDDWPRRLIAAIEAAERTAFATGTFDCVLFTADCVAAITGIDPAAPFRGRYSTRLEAARLLRGFAGGGLRETAERLARELGCPEIPVLFAQRGDVGFIIQPPLDVLAICVGAHWAAPAPALARGLDYLPLGSAALAWRIG